jgi:hypothetical protein
MEPERPQMTLEYDACALRAGQRRLHTQNMQYLLLVHGSNGFSNAPRYYIIRTVPFVFGDAVYAFSVK